MQCFFLAYGDTSQLPMVPTGRGTPFTLSKALRADFLHLSVLETEELVQDFCERVRMQYLTAIILVIHVFTGGHIGMTCALLEAWYHYYNWLEKSYSTDGFFDFLLSSSGTTEHQGQIYGS